MARRRSTRRNNEHDASLSGPQRLAKALVGTDFDPSTLYGPYGDPAPLQLRDPPVGPVHIVAERSPECLAQHTKHEGFWICLTHSQRFDNQFQKDTHIHEGTHVLAWYCTRCQEVQVP